MTNVLLSCQCRKVYEISPPLPGDELLCLDHGPVVAMELPSVLECQDCDFRKQYPSLAKLRICVAATKHMMQEGHEVCHYNQFDRDGTMCLHVPSKVPKFTAEGPPPF